MNRFIFPIGLTVLWLCASSHAATSEVHFPQKHQTFFKKHCLDCHDTATQEGGVDLEALSFTIATIEQAERWQKVLNVLNSGEMPPEDSGQPEGIEKADFLDDLAQTMVSARRSLADSGGRITMRRLNRREYQNTIEQLLGLKVDVSSLPADGGSGTFDTVGASQFISSDQIEQYLKLGRSAIDEAFERQATRQQPSKIFRVEPENTVNVLSRKKIAEQEEMYQRYLLWKAEVDKAALLPENKKVLAELREKYNLDDLTNSIRLYQNTGLLKGAPDATKFGFRDGNKASFSYQGGYDRTQAYMKQYLDFPNSDRGTYLKLAWGIQRIDVVPDPKDVPPGKYTLRIRAGVVEGSDPSRHFIEIGHPQRVNGVLARFSGKPLAGLQVLGTEDNPEIIETTLVIGLNTPREFGIQERQPESSKKMLSTEFYSYKRENGYGTPPAIWVDWIELEGPLTESAVTESAITRVEPEKTINPANEDVIKQIEEQQSRFEQWKKGVDEAAKSPENQAIIAEIRKTDRLIDHPNRFYTFADRLKGTPNPRDFGFSDVKKAAAADPSRSRSLALHKHYVGLPHRDRGTYLKLTHGTGRVIVKPKEMPPGNYVMRVRVGVVEGTPASRRFIQVGHPQREIESRDWGLEGRALSSHQVSGTIDNPEVIEIPLEVGTSTPKEFAVQEKQTNNGSLKVRWDEHNTLKAENGYGHPPAIWIDWVEIEGPLPEGGAVASTTYRVEPEKTINPQNEKSIKELEDSFLRFTQWRKGVDEAVKTPENQAIIAEIAKKEKDILDPLRFYRFTDRLKGIPDARDFGFDQSRAPQSANPDWPNLHAYLKHYASLPYRDTGAYLKPTKGTGRVIVSPEKLPVGNYTLRVRVGAVEGSDPSRHFIQVGHPQRTYTGPDWDWGLEGRAISTNQVTGTIEEPQILEIPLEVGPNTIREFSVQEKQPNNGKPKALFKTFNAAKKENGYGIPPAIWIDWVELEGPHSSSRKQWKQRREVELHANAKVGGTYNGYFKGGYEKGKAFLDAGKPQKGIVDEQEAKFRIRQFEEEGPVYRRYLDDPLTQVGSFLTISNVNKEEYIALPPEHPSGWKKTEHIVESLPPGTYKLRCRIGAVEGTSAERHFVDLGAVPDTEHFDRLATFQITGSTDEPEIIELPVQLTKNSPRKFALREKRDVKADAGRDRDARKENGVGLKPALWIDWVEWEGPLDVSNESGRRNWWITEADEPDESLRAQKMIELFALEAFRGVEPEAEYIQQLSDLFALRRKAGDSFDTAIRLPLSIILASPGFLYLNEPNDADDRRQLTDRELAVRLAYFLWSAPPDRELLELAKQQKLSQPETLRQQVDRMIADSRSDEFISGFVHQWLDMERLDFFQFDTRLYRDFDESTRSAAREEVYQSFAHLFRGGQNGRISQLLKSDTVFINGLLANYYGIEGITGDEFQKVSLPAGSPRGGLLGMAAIHAMGSDGVVSSPVERGAWVLRHLLHDPPPPAPPNVPQISRLQGEILTTRERLRMHQEEAQCASCHRKIDPIGLGLENFNAAGKWRTTDSFQARDKRGRGVGKKKTWDIDPSGAIYNGPSFADYFELREIVVSRQDDFARGFTEHLIEYALGRPFGFTDEDFAEEVVQSAKIKDYAVSEFVHAVVQSKAFQSK
ncbi:MAG: DUF1592 domain-containing protein [Pirellulales bacterium]